MFLLILLAGMWAGIAVGHPSPEQLTNAGSYATAHGELVHSGAGLCVGAGGAGATREHVTDCAVAAAQPIDRGVQAVIRAQSDRDALDAAGFRQGGLE